MASKTLLKTMIVARDTLIPVYITTDPGTRIELNLVTENMRAAVDLRRIPPIPCKTISMYIGN